MYLRYLEYCVFIVSPVLMTANAILLDFLFGAELEGGLLFGS